MNGPSPQEFLTSVISTWEGLLSTDANDPGNWIDGRLVGSMRGVTGAALALYKGVPVSSITADDVKAVTLDDAVAIGLKHYYAEPHFDRLPWAPAAASLLDFGWGSGPWQATLSMQRMVGANADGALGPITAEAYEAWHDRLGWQAAAGAIHKMRASFYAHICDISPNLNVYLAGWNNRNDWASEANADWWRQWGTN